MSLYDFQSLKAQLGGQVREREEDAKAKAQEKIDKYNENVKDPLEGVAFSGIEDTSLNLVQSGIKSLGSKAGKKLGISDKTIKKFTDTVDNIDVKDLLKNPKQALKNALQGGGDELDKMSNIDFSSITNADDFKTAKQSLTDKLKQLPSETQDAIESKLKDSAVKTTEEIRQLPIEDQLAEKIKQQGAAQDAFNDAIKPVTRDVKDATKKLPDIAEDALNTAEKAGKKELEKGVEKGLSKAGATFAETDAELGGPLDVVGDVVAGAVALGSAIFGIKHKPKLQNLPRVQQISTSLSLGLDTA
tara:strand:- start:483 stop:1388 length:906 start_codon:yes stop_codon:yes gene_type:complete